MILCLDAGNTRLKWGLREGRSWRTQGVFALDEIGGIATLLPAVSEHILACNVAGDAVAQRIEDSVAPFGVPLEWFKSTAACCGVTNGYANPAQLGADRWAALVGARGLHAGNALVVMSGTATTIDVLGADGKFRGGLILPGLELMQKSLARNTAGLPEARGAYRDIPANTDDAIASGALQATLGAIERMQRLACRPVSADFCVLLSGGAADALAPHLDLPLRRVDNLVLEGLARVAAGC
jgi:type III pantothenate kinase